MTQSYPNYLGSEILVIRIDPVVKAIPFSFRPVYSDPDEVLLRQSQPQLLIKIVKVIHSEKFFA